LAYGVKYIIPKNFLAGFFGVIAAVVVLVLAGNAYLTYQAHEEARGKAESLKHDALLLASGCRVLDVDDRTEVARTLDADLDTYEKLLLDAGDDYGQADLGRAGLENQFRFNGCYRSTK